MSDPAPSPAVSPALSVRDLRVDYGAGRRRGATVPLAVDGVSFEVARGEFVALVGESGSGKSTLAGAVTGLLPASARVLGGQIRLGDRVVASPEVRLGERAWSRVRGRRVGMIPQDPGSSLTPVLTIGAQIEEIFAIRGERLGRSERRAKAIELLETAEVSRAAERLGQFPHELSGGLKQRILIAIAFGLNPALIVADEPTSALDVTVQRQVLRVFDRLATEHGTSVLFVTHDIALATDHAARALVLQRGELLEDSPVEAVVASPGSAYTSELIRHARATAVAAPAATDAAPLLRVQGLGRLFPARAGVSALQAVDDVSFVLPAGQTLALVGESGSGKSTTARMVMGLVDPTAGSVHLRDEDVTAVHGRRRRALWREFQMVYQNPDSALDPRWTVRDIVAEPLRGIRRAEGGLSRHDLRARVDELLEAVALPAGSADKRPSELSGGQRQRVAIARALAPRSSLVVLDEALSALDVITQEQVLTLLGRLQRELGVSYLFISHDLSVVRRIAHHVTVMQAGRVVESGPTEQVFGAPRTEYVRDLLAAIPGTRLLHPAPPAPETP